ncbi:MAG: hypothetical protein A2Y33_13835 [Spirochaetes bacterium GWF1_51_8]|nr:MAG: hypothetical protein A2Y33_13835 [Spirochaetes bacterium GWF1_51_8]
MKIETIRITNFRNIARIDLKDFSQTNILLGGNGEGKTNFLEAIHMLSALSPLRNVSFHELIRWGENYFHLHAEFGGNMIELGFSEKKRLLKINGDKSNKAALCGLSPVTAFLPSDIDIVAGTPENRRFFLDRALSMIDPLYENALRRYYRTLRQRNAQLKLKPREVHIWDKELVLWGSLIITKRLPFIRILNQKVQDIYRDLYGMDIRIRYMNPFRIDGGIEESFREAIRTGAQEEMRRKHSLFGPHRDNFIFQWEEKESSSFVSQGQLRALAFALKLGSVRSIEDYCGKAPVLLIDDVLLEIDAARRNKLIGMIAGKYQTFFTVTSPDILKGVLSDPAVFHIAAGSIEKAK